MPYSTALPIPPQLTDCRAEMLSTTFLPFALFDSNDHSFAIDIGDFQADSLGDAQPGSATGRQALANGASVSCH
jgi:hypothetical protein